MQLLQHEHVDIFFANNVLAILLQMKTFSGVIFHSQRRVCDEHQAREGQHGGILGRRGNLNVLKCFRANHCKHKYALTKWYMY